MGYWKSKVLPKIKKVFEKNGSKKAAAAEICKSFDDSKEAISKELEEKKTELEPKVIEVYAASSTEIKTVVKERKDEGIKKNSPAVQKFLEELVKIEFPGSKQVHEASTKFGPTLVSGPVFFVFEKVSTFIATEEKEGETTVTTETVEETSKEKEVVIEEEKEKEKEEEKAPEVVPEKVEAAPEATPPEPPKVEEEAPKP
ncbi:plasma membrane-associated cation-binding protein 1 [Cinnamomum micranthum f. kanehirae]|uniref:Plasma membrane-associated cation-binding protein 1 n=1 Tax=Cinnamomum micranthum f. kanehirae TaxID=337451 RepID=A0A3S3R8U4_9MAGN|nr:plasma membrane-associated cation-binding protein 1 [Cinnamomum micranthum f. kanehirae]